MSNEALEPAFCFAAFVGLDWADRKHVWALRAADADGVEHGELENTPEAVEAWVARLSERFRERPIAVALEQARGPLVFMLSKYAHLVLFPVHPATLSSYRDAFSPSGAKDDPTDADLLLDLLMRHRDRLRCWQPDTVETRTLQFLVEHRRRLVDEKTRQSHRLSDQLKLYFPQILDWFEEVDSALVGDLLKRWPTLEQLQRARPATLRQFFHQHNCRSAQLIEQRLQQIGQAIPATQDQAVLQSSASFVLILVQLIDTLRKGIAALDRQIAGLFASHPEFSLFDSLPGAGPVLAPRLLAALGTRRERFSSAQQIQCYSGIAPVLERSGNTQWTHLRRACSKFLRQTFHTSGPAIPSAFLPGLAGCCTAAGKIEPPYDEARHLETLRRRHAAKPDPTRAFQWKGSDPGIALAGRFRGPPGCELARFSQSAFQALTHVHFEAGTSAITARIHHAVEGISAENAELANATHCYRGTYGDRGGKQKTLSQLYFLCFQRRGRQNPA